MVDVGYYSLMGGAADRNVRAPVHQFLMLVVSVLIVV